jgi:hypothetical protein
MRIPPDHLWLWHFGAFWLLLLALIVGLEVGL